jgi:hypothetical protein
MGAMSQISDLGRADLRSSSVGMSAERSWGAWNCFGVPGTELLSPARTGWTRMV